MAGSGEGGNFNFNFYFGNRVLRRCFWGFNRGFNKALIKFEYGFNRGLTGFSRSKHLLGLPVDTQRFRNRSPWPRIDPGSGYARDPLRYYNARADPSTCFESRCLGSASLPSLRIGNQNYNFYLVVGRFPAELGPETRSNGSGSKNGAERTQN